MRSSSETRIQAKAKDCNLISAVIRYRQGRGLRSNPKSRQRGCYAYFLLHLEYQLMKIIQYRNNNATILIQYGFSKTGFGRVLRYAITLIVTITESAATAIFRSLSFSISLPSFHKLIYICFYLGTLQITLLSFIFHYINCKMLFW